LGGTKNIWRTLPPNAPMATVLILSSEDTNKFFSTYQCLYRRIKTRWPCISCTSRKLTSATFQNTF